VVYPGRHGYSKKTTKNPNPLPKQNTNLQVQPYINEKLQNLEFLFTSSVKAAPIPILQSDTNQPASKASVEHFDGNMLLLIFL